MGNDIPLGTEALSSLVAAIVGLAIGASVLLREPRRSTHVLFATFAFNIALVKLFSFFATYLNTDFFLWATMLAAVSLPATAQRFFQAFLGDEAGPPPLSRSTVVGAVVFYLALCASHFSFSSSRCTRAPGSGWPLPSTCSPGCTRRSITCTGATGPRPRGWRRFACSTWWWAASPR